MADDGNSSSRARDHLANERTYLAWLRTSANVMILGLAIAKFAGSGGTYALIAGGILVGVAAIGIVYGTLRYRRITDEIEQERFDTGSRGRGPTASGAVLILAVIAAFVLLTRGGGSG